MHNELFFIVGALLGAAFATCICWRFLLQASVREGYARGLSDAYALNASKIPASMGMWRWPEGDEDV